MAAATRTDAQVTAEMDRRRNANRAAMADAASWLQQWADEQDEQAARADAAAWLQDWATRN